MVDGRMLHVQIALPYFLLLVRQNTTKVRKIIWQAKCANGSVVWGSFCKDRRMAKCYKPLKESVICPSSHLKDHNDVST